MFCFIRRRWAHQERPLSPDTAFTHCTPAPAFPVRLSEHLQQLESARPLLPMKRARWTVGDGRRRAPQSDLDAEDREESDWDDETTTVSITSRMIHKSATAEPALPGLLSNKQMARLRAVGQCHGPMRPGLFVVHRCTAGRPLSRGHACSLACSSNARPSGRPASLVDDLGAAAPPACVCRAECAGRSWPGGGEAVTETLWRNG